MNKQGHRHPVVKAAAVLLLAAGAGAAIAQTTHSEQAARAAQATQGNQPAQVPKQTATNAAARTFEGAKESDQLAEATGHLNRAIGVLKQMERNRELAALMARSKGVFVVPDSVNVAVGVGARGGAGVLLVRRAGGWGTPAFYNMAGLTVGAQLGAEGGAIAFVLNDQKALDSFARPNKIALNAAAGLTVVDWSKKGGGSAGLGNITAWADTEGLFGGANISVTDINFDEPENAAYYNRAVTAAEILAGKVGNPHAAALNQALAATDGAGAAGVGGRNDTKGRGRDSDLHPAGR